MSHDAAADLHAKALPMAHPSDSDRRKKRDAALRTQDEAIADHLAQAYRMGELQSAESFGKPMKEADGYFETPAEFRMPFKVLKNAGVTPPEVELFHKRADLRRQLDAAGTEAERKSLQQRLSELEQMLALRLEGMRASGKL
jgi:hypothetical protein